MSGLVFVIPLIAVVIALSIWGWHRTKKRREALLALAARHGLSFDPGHDRGHDSMYNHFGVFTRGHSRSAFNTIEGEMELAGRRMHVRMGDYRYRQTSGSGKNRSTQTYTFSYCIVHLPWPHCPNVLIRREGLFDKIAAAVGFEDIDFESAEFSKRFLVKGSDKRFAFDVIDPRMMEFLLQHEPPTPIDIEYGKLSMTDGSRRWDPARFETTLGYAEHFLSRWPDHLVLSLDESMGTYRSAV